MAEQRIVCVGNAVWGTSFEVDHVPFETTRLYSVPP
jgi:hypothetical protein